MVSPLRSANLVLVFVVGAVMAMFGGLQITNLPEPDASSYVWKALVIAGVIIIVIVGVVIFKIEKGR